MSITSRTSVLPSRARRSGLAVLALAVCVPVGARADGLESELLKNAPRVLKYLRDRGYHNVGVLKFRVQKGKGSLTDNAGPLNLTVARRLELALVLANDVSKPLGIIQDASAVAAKLRGANHLTKNGRRKLFQGRYPLAWGDQQVRPDAFVTGVVQVNSRLNDMSVDVAAFGKDGGGLTRVVQFTASMDAVGLAESGESFLLRGAFENGQVELTEAKAVQAAARVRERRAKYPLDDPRAPVELRIYYDGKRVPLEIHDGAARVKEPHQGQKVTFVLARRGKSKERYGVVLKVNGENTFGRQRLPDLQCRKWVLDPGDRPITIRGYQSAGNSAEEFRVLSREESKAREMDYGADVGTLSLVVFRARRGPDRPSADLSYEAEDLAALQRGVFPRKRPLNLAALQFQLREDGRRGIVAEGQKIDSKVRRVSFKPDPVPVLTATISYYRP